MFVLIAKRTVPFEASNDGPMPAPVPAD